MQIKISDLPSGMDADSFLNHIGQITIEAVVRNDKLSTPDVLVFYIQNGSEHELAHLQAKGYKVTEYQQQ